MSAFARWMHGREHIQLLLHWRWLVLAIAIPVSFVIEFIEEQGTELDLLDEVLIDGIVLPLTTWIVLTFAARRMARQFAREQALEQRQQFTQRLAEQRDYYDLIHFLVRSRGSARRGRAVADDRPAHLRAAVAQAGRGGPGGPGARASRRADGARKRDPRPDRAGLHQPADRGQAESQRAYRGIPPGEPDGQARPAQPRRTGALRRRARADGPGRVGPPIRSLPQNHHNGRLWFFHKAGDAAWRHSAVHSARCAA